MQIADKKNCYLPSHIHMYYFKNHSVVNLCVHNITFLHTPTELMMLYKIMELYPLIVRAVMENYFSVTLQSKTYCTHSCVQPMHQLMLCPLFVYKVVYLTIISPPFFNIVHAVRIVINFTPGSYMNSYM